MRKTTILLKGIFLVIILFSFPGFAQAQKGTINGVVNDDNGPIFIALVIIEGKGNGTTNNDKDEYELKVNLRKLHNNYQVCPV